MVFEITGEGSGEDGIDSVEAKRSPLSLDFSFYIRKDQENPRATAIVRTIRNRNGWCNEHGVYFEMCASETCE